MNLFSKVHCYAYLKEVQDGAYIEVKSADGKQLNGNAFPADATATGHYYDSDGNEYTKDLSSFDGDSIEKVYRVRTELEFSGVIVGFINLIVKASIGTDWDDNPYNPHGYCYKEPTEKPRVALVYFRNNSKRYVLLEDMIEL